MFAKRLRYEMLSKRGHEPIKNIFGFGAKQNTKEDAIRLTVDIIPITESCHLRYLLNRVIAIIVPVKINKNYIQTNSVT